MTEPRAPVWTKLAALVSRRDLAWLAAGLLAAAITVLSLMPRPAQVLDVKLWDKFAHFLAYGALSLVVTHALRRSGWQGAAMLGAAALGCSAFGGLMELLQGYFPPRSPDTMDAVANTIGSFLGVGIFAALSRGWAWVQSRRIQAEDEAPAG